MKLYTADLSAYSARVRMQIYAKGITDIVIEPPGEHWGMPQFRERFPIGRVPVLDIDGDTMPESEVIAEYLEAIYPEPSLLLQVRGGRSVEGGGCAKSMDWSRQLSEVKLHEPIDGFVLASGVPTYRLAAIERRRSFNASSFV